MAEPYPEEVLQFVQQSSYPFVTTGDVAGEFDSVTERTIRERLKTLAEEGQLEYRKVGPHAKVWYLPDQPRDEASFASP